MGFLFDPTSIKTLPLIYLIAKDRGHFCLVPKKGASLQSFAIKYISGNVFIDVGSNRKPILWH